MITFMQDARCGIRYTRSLRMKTRIAAILMMLMACPCVSHSFTVSDLPETSRMSTALQTIEQNRDIDPAALQLALQGYYNLKRQGLIRREGIITLIDFDKPSDSERFFIIDVNSGTVLRSALVAHGRNSGDIYATSFSNTPGSYKSSLGFYLTENTYNGKNGYSLVLKGLDKGMNDKAEQRSIVIHGADYVSRDYIRLNGHLGRSEGCPALSMETYQEVIDLIKGGSCLFIYHNERDYSSSSDVLDPDMAFKGGQWDNPS
jgi:hypothetical protein